MTWYVCSLQPLAFFSTPTLRAMLEVVKDSVTGTPEYAEGVDVYHLDLTVYWASTEICDAIACDAF